jgi:hypothetical protein
MPPVGRLPPRGAVRQDGGRDDGGLSVGDVVGGQRQAGERPGGVPRTVVNGGGVDGAALTDQGDLGDVHGLLAGLGMHGGVVDGVDLASQGAVVVEGPPDGLAAPDGALAGRLLRHGAQLAVAALDGDELVDHAGGGVSRAGGDPGAGAVPVDGGVGQCGDDVFVEVGGDSDAGVGRPERVEQDAGVAGLLGEVPGVEADGSGAGDAGVELTGGGDGVADALRGCRRCRRGAWCPRRGWRPGCGTRPSRSRGPG